MKRTIHDSMTVHETTFASSKDGVTAMKVCTNVNGNEICFQVPLLVVPWHIGPIPEKPQPDPWFTFKGVGPEIAQQVQAIGTLAHAAAFLPEEHRTTMNTAIEHVVAGMERKLPGLKFHNWHSGSGPDPAVP